MQMRMRSGWLGQPAKWLADARTFISLRLRVIRDALVWLLPLLMVASTIHFCAALLDFMGVSPDIVHTLNHLNGRILALMPYALSIAISTMLAIQCHLPRPTISLLNMAYVAMILGIIGIDTATAQTLAFSIGLILPFLTVPIIWHLFKQSWTHLASSELAGTNIKTNLNLILPGLITAFLLLSTEQIISWLWPARLDLLSSAFVGHDPLTDKLLYAGLNSLLWSVGIHGYYALLPLLHALDTGSTNGHPASTFLGVFVFIGGSGATLSLTIALLLFAKTRTHRVLALSSLPIACFNVNELLLFGLPIMYNPRLIAPFFLVPISNTLIGHFAISLGMVQLMPVEVPFTSPILINAWLSSGGSLQGILLQLICIATGVALYAPFVRLHEKGTHSREIHFRSFDTTFTQMHEEAVVLLDDPIGLQQQKALDRHKLNLHLKKLSSLEFFLQYQPQIHPETHRITGCESLIRARRESGEISMPGDFLPWFEKAGLMKNIDFWVLEKAIQQSRIWRRAGLDLEITVNISTDSLSDRTMVEQMIQALENSRGRINFEITEQALASDVEQVRWALEKISGTGARIYIDDFGTDYSSLAYLHHYPIDAIKIDRSFVLALGNERGQKVFDGLIAFAQRLDLGIVVEGVEAPEQLAWVPNTEKVSVQGWYYSKAIDPEKMQAFSQRFWLA